MKKITLLCASLLAAAVLYAQNSGELRMVKSRIYDGSQVITPKQAMLRLESHPEAYALFKKAKTNYDASMVMGYVGGFLIGWPIGTAIGGGEPEWAMLGAGAAIVVLSIPLTTGYKKNAHQAIALYNGQPVTRHNGIRANLDCYGTGMRLTWRF